MKNIFNNTFFWAIFWAVTACNNGPKVIESEPAASTSASGNSGILPGMGGAATTAAPLPGNNEQHTIVAKETLHTDKYTYVRASENNQEFWIAIPKTNVQIGATYYYTGGLMKTNFQSKEFNRTFETLYLVSGLSTQSGGGSGMPAANQPMPANAPETASSPTKVIEAKGSVKIADLIGNLSKYDGKTIKVTGKCVKINPMIMGRNWIHIQDGTANNFDLTVTTNEPVELGATLTLEGTIAINKDFGAGYKYNVIMEGAKIR